MIMHRQRNWIIIISYTDKIIVNVAKEIELEFLHESDKMNRRSVKEIELWSSIIFIKSVHEFWKKTTRNC